MYKTHTHTPSHSLPHTHTHTHTLLQRRFRQPSRLPRWSSLYPAPPPPPHPPLPTEEASDLWPGDSTTLILIEWCSLVSVSEDRSTSCRQVSSMSIEWSYIQSAKKVVFHYTCTIPLLCTFVVIWVLFIVKLPMYIHLTNVVNCPCNVDCNKHVCIYSPPYSSHVHLYYICACVYQSCLY